MSNTEPNFKKTSDNILKRIWEGNQAMINILIKENEAIFDEIKKRQTDYENLKLYEQEQLYKEGKLL